MIEIVNLGFSYGNKTIFKNFNLTVQDNDICIVKGNIGTGKTTLFRILTGFYTNFTGSIKINGKDIKDIDLSKTMTFVEQNSDYQLLTLSVKNELELFSNSIIDKEMVDYFELEHFLNRNPQTLSSSEKRRVLLAGVFSSKLDYIFMDEPTADLDAYFTHKLLQLIEKEKRTTIIFTHDKKLKTSGKFNTFKL